MASYKGLPAVLCGRCHGDKENLTIRKNHSIGFGYWHAA
jgi:hypothetical protein